MSNNLEKGVVINKDFRDLDDDVDLLSLFTLLWKHKFIISIITCIGAISAVIYSLSLSNTYKSSALLAPSEAATTNGNQLSSQLSGLAGIAGINIGNGNDKIILGLEILTTRSFFEEFGYNEKFLIDLFALKEWDAETDSEIIDPDIYDLESERWTRTVTPPKTQKPSLQEAHELFLESLTIDRNKGTGMVNVSVEHHSPYKAKELVGLVIKQINQTMLKKDVEQAKKSIEYLTLELEATKLEELRSNLFELIEANTKTIMFANINPEYLFQVLDPPIVPEVKHGPKRAVICIVATILSFLLGVLIVIVRDYFTTQFRANTAKSENI